MLWKSDLLLGADEVHGVGRHMINMHREAGGSESICLYDESRMKELEAPGDASAGPQPWHFTMRATA